MTFYHVTRSENNLREDIELRRTGNVISSPTAVSPSTGEQIDLDPGYYEDNRFSNHGMTYASPISSNNMTATDDRGRRYSRSEVLAEQVFEMVRLKEFSDRPSRFKAFFGTETLEEARQFNQEYRNGEGEIWKVDSEDSFKADMKLIAGPNLIANAGNAQVYWSGETYRENLFWEVLMEYPIRVIEMVD